MELNFIDRASLSNSSFRVSVNKGQYFLKVWHYHPELELVLIVEGKGKRFIGDSIDKFQEGDVVLIGGDLPHMWLSDEAYFVDNHRLKVKAIAVHFKRDFLGEHFFELPETLHIGKMVLLAKRGLIFKNVHSNVVNRIMELPKQKALSRALSLIEILSQLSKQKKPDFISSWGFLNRYHDTENKRLQKIYGYVNKNFQRPISSKKVAQIANMNPSAFSRFFSQANGKTFTRYINEIRIGYACKLLIENDKNVASVCFESGFNNISNFNRQFKAITKVSPSDYFKRHRF